MPKLCVSVRSLMTYVRMQRSSNIHIAVPVHAPPLVSGGDCTGPLSLAQRCPTAADVDTATPTANSCLERIGLRDDDLASWLFAERATLQPLWRHSDMSTPGEPTRTGRFSLVRAATTATA